MKYPLIAMFITYTVFSIANCFSNLFLTTYIWKQHNSLMIVGGFQAFSFLFTFVGIIIGAYLIKWQGSRVNFLCSSMIALILYVFLINIPSPSISYVSIAGIFNGLYIGLFFAGMNFYSLWFSQHEELSGVISLQYFINASVQLLIPPFAGWLIYTNGYQLAFLLAVFIIMIQMTCSVLTPQIRIRYPFRKKGFFIPENKQMRHLGLSAASFGFFYAFVFMSVSVFVYLNVQNESTLGELNMLFALLTVVTYFILGKKLLQPYRETIGILGVIISTVVTFTLFFPYPLSFIVFNVIISVSLPMMWIPTFTLHFSTIKNQVQLSNANPLTKMMELLVFREFYLCIGRVLFLLLLIVSVTYISNGYLTILVMLLSFMPACLFLFGKRTSNN